MGRLVQFLMVLVALAVFASSVVLAAGGGELPPEPELPNQEFYSDFSLAGSFTLPDVTGRWSSTESYWNEDEVRATLDFNLKNHELGDASWNFYYGYEPNTWSASFHAYGFLLDQESPSLVLRRQSSNLRRDDLNLDTRINVGPYYDWHYKGDDEWVQEEEWFRLEAEVLLKPAAVTSTSCYYQEYTNDWPWMDEPENRWSLSYYVYGEFLQPDPVPEPSTICLLLSFVASGAFALVRYRQR